MYSEDTGNFVAHDHCSCTSEPVFITSNVEEHVIDHPLEFPDTGAPDLNPVRRQVIRSEMRDFLGQQVPKLTEEMQSGIDAYAENGFSSINSFLRTGPLKMLPTDFVTPSGFQAFQAETNMTKKYIENLDAAIARAPKIKTPMVVWRGLGLQTKELEALVPGSRFTDGAYVSTTLDRSVAVAFSEKSSGYPVVMKVIVPKGTRLLAPSLGKSVNGTAEMELLTARGRTFRVIERQGREITAVMQ